MNKKCPNCKLVDFIDVEECRRCGSAFTSVQVRSEKTGSSIAVKILWRAGICTVVVIGAIAAFYLSLLLTSSPLKYDEKAQVKRAIAVLSASGFTQEVFLLNNLTSFRGNDNWLNASVEKENAYAATNFPFEIMTIYPDFFKYPMDDVERAAILLHEAQHLKGADEKEAYEYVWKNRKKLGWTREKYWESLVWLNVRKQTREFSPNLFVCTVNDYGDCTETDF
jgi:hypothetical protein